MNFSYSDEQQAIFDLASQILSDGTPQERLREIEQAEGPRFDPELWTRMGEAGLVGIAVPEPYDGGGLGFLELAGVMEQIGRTAAPIPFFETAILGAPAIAEFGSEAQKRTILPEVAAGQRVLTAALVEGETPIETPSTRATESLATTSGMPESMMQLDGVRVGADALLGELGQGGEIIAFIDLRANAALCNLALGVCEAALELTAEYSKTRKQFDQPIAMFQSVSHREADAYIDTQAVRLSALEVAWMISVGRDAAEEVAIAKHFASEAGYRVTFSAQHIHGGIGVDREYPVHRYYIYARHLELMLGGSTHHMRRLGKQIAENAAA
jgi:acyl-CoA dehydrogenase